MLLDRLLGHGRQQNSVVVLSSNLWGTMGKSEREVTEGGGGSPGKFLQGKARRDMQGLIVGLISNL
jgi:hypothetical protein